MTWFLGRVWRALEGPPATPRKTQLLVADILHCVQGILDFRGRHSGDPLGAERTCLQRKVFPFWTPIGLLCPFFFLSEPVAFRRVYGLESYSRTSGESNRHRKSVSTTRVMPYQLHHEDDCYLKVWRCVLESWNLLLVHLFTKMAEVTIALINGQHAACNSVLIDLAKAQKRWTGKKT